MSDGSGLKLHPRPGPQTGPATVTEQPTPTYKPESAQNAKSGCAGCALSSPCRTSNHAADAKKGDTGHPTAARLAIE